MLTKNLHYTLNLTLRSDHPILNVNEDTEPFIKPENELEADKFLLHSRQATETFADFHLLPDSLSSQQIR